MAWLGGRFERSILIAPLVLLCACDQVRSVLPAQGDVKYELKQDSQGRTIRLNKSTGEVAIIDGTALTPGRQAEAPSKLPKSSAPPTSQPSGFA